MPASKETMTSTDSFPDPARELRPALPTGREAAMLRHDIRGALQGVLGGVSQIELATLPDAAREQVERVAAAAETLARLIAAAEADETGPAAPFELDRFLELVRRRHAGEARAHGLVLEIEAAANAPAGLALDLTAMIRIVENLIGNALKYAQHGGIRLAVSRGVDGAILLRVSDDGPGLGASLLGRRSPRSGQGLGLHIVHSLTERLGGTVTIGNRQGGGVEALLRFPATVAVESVPALPASAGDLSGLRVLLAEDNPTNQMVASQMLRTLNAMVTVCADGIEALEAFERQPVDLVVVDIEMPRLSGLDVIRAIRARGDERAEVPIVALTAYAMREHRERIFAAGANGLISKPITSVEALGRALAGHLGARHLEEPADTGSATRDDLLAIPVIDQAIFDALAEAIGPDTMAELIDKVISDLRGAQATLAASLASADRPAVRSASHILSSVAGAIGAVRLQSCARTLNALAHGEDNDRTPAEVRRCIAEIDTAVGFADRWREARA